MKLTALALTLVSVAAFAATEENLNKTFSATASGTLVVEVNVGTIDVTTNSTEEVAVAVWRKVSRKNKAEEAEYLSEHPVEFSQDGNTISVRCRRSDEQQRGWFNWGGGNRNEAKYTIKVPAHFSTKLNTAGGGINVSDLTGDVKANTSGGGLKFARLHGPLNGNTSGGGIRVSDTEGEIKIGTSGGGIEVTGGSGSLKGNTSGGPVTVKAFSGPVSVSTSGGGITIENATGKVEGNTSGGGINVTLASKVTDGIKLSTSGGGVTLKVPEGAAFNLDASTSGGGVTCDLPVTVQGKIERNRLKGPVNGGGPEVSLHTSGGGIHVKKL
jgi:Putative adhesin